MGSGFHQSVLHPLGPQALEISHIWWLILGITLAAYAATLLALGAALWRRQRDTEERVLGRWIGWATGISTVLLFVILAASVVAGQRSADFPTTGGIDIVLTGNQWWWNAEYQHPENPLRIRVANELHIPVGRSVRFILRSNDVIHSFWIPNLHGKRDMIPGQDNVITLRADAPGVYRGQCAEFCGAQHANMTLWLVAEYPAEFDKWYGNQAQPARVPETEQQHKGMEVFLLGSCALCHTIRGTQAGGRAGPDLTHVASRGKLAAGAIENTPGGLGGWISNPHSVKPGVRMPANLLPAADLRALVSYLQHLP